jgi:hypothetical protein
LSSGGELRVAVLLAAALSFVAAFILLKVAERPRGTSDGRGDRGLGALGR